VLPEDLFVPPAAGTYVAYAGIGSRKTPRQVCELMTAIAQALELRGFTLRSGGAPGADQAFEAGTSDDRLREIYLPAAGWRGSTSRLHPDAIAPELWAKARAIAEEHHPAWQRVRPGSAQALQTRNSFQVLGPDLRSPSSFVIAWTLNGTATGGTGQALRIARTHGIPVLNLHDPACRRAIETELRI
jgi:hypothetical protein